MQTSYNFSQKFLNNYMNSVSKLHVHVTTGKLLYLNISGTVRKCRDIRHDLILEKKMIMALHCLYIYSIINTCIYFADIRE